MILKGSQRGGSKQLADESNVALGHACARAQRGGR